MPFSRQIAYKGSPSAMRSQIALAMSLVYLLCPPCFFREGVFAFVMFGMDCPAPRAMGRETADCAFARTGLCLFCATRGTLAVPHTPVPRPVGQDGNCWL